MISVTGKVTSLHGQEMRVVSVPHFPYCDFEKNNQDPGGLVTFKDSIDSRLIQILSEQVNFT